MRIIIVGTGGVGGYFGGRLATAGHDVHFIARGAHLAAMKANGLVVKSINGDFTVNPVQANEQVQPSEVAELIIFCVKDWQLSTAIELVRPAVAESTMLISLLNGITASEKLTTAFDPKQVLGGLCRIISKIEAPGIITHMAAKPTIEFGELYGGLSDRVNGLKDSFTDAGIHTIASTDIQANIWRKFLFICTVSGVGAIAQQPIGTFRTNPQYKTLLRGCAEEIYQLALKKDINLEKDIVTKTLGYIDQLPVHSTASMQRDIGAGRPSELEAQNGRVVQLGKEFGVPTPTNDRIYEQLLPLEIKARRAEG